MYGVTSEIVEFESGTIVRINEGSEERPVWIPTQILGEVDLALKAGDRIEVIGKIKPYKTSWEIEVTAKNGVRKIGGVASEPAVTGK